MMPYSHINHNHHMPLLAYALFLFSLLMSGIAQASSNTVQHQLTVRLSPGAGHLEVTDRISLPKQLLAKGDAITFMLHAGLAPKVRTAGARLKAMGRLKGRVPLERYALHLPAGVDEVTLHYGGIISHTVTSSAEDVGKAREDSPGTIGSDGVFLDGASGWYPLLPDTLQRFRMSVALPPRWLAISQGAGPNPEETTSGIRVHWQENQPQDDIYLVAAPFTLYRHATPHGEAQVFLRTPDPALARRYLEATAGYLELYSRLLGPYPYAKFALVENFWESGYGMPSFTLLGSRVIRLPFILHSSYPHEILHNWWGNSVYIDYPSGNWSEGLTTYLADYLLKERAGGGAEYRRNALKRYTEYTDRQRDFPLKSFTARHGDSSQAVGYDKSMMLFHMLRRELGDELFLEGLRRFYRDNRFRTAGFGELRRAFENTAGRDLCDAFDQWLIRPGAPRLRLGKVETEHGERGHRLTFALEQTQDESLFILQVPVAIQLEGLEGVLVKRVKMAARNQLFTLELPARPVRLAIDPAFDIFRRLDPAELPPSLGQHFSAERLNLVLPSAAPPTMRQAYQALASGWSQGQPQVQLHWDSELDGLPATGAVWLLGWENRFMPAIRDNLDPASARLYSDHMEILGKSYSSTEHSPVLTALNGEGRPLAWLAAHTPEAVAGLARKVPHYGKYSYLIFQGDVPENVLKGQWPVSSSPLSKQLEADAPALHMPLPPSLLSRIDALSAANGVSSGK